MSLRLVELVLPEGYHNVLREALQKVDILDFWEKTLDDARLHVKILVPTEHTENVLDLMEKRFSHMEGFRIILLPVEATIPRPTKGEKTHTENRATPLAKHVISRWIRVSREELYSDIEKTVRLSWIFLAMVFFSSIVASIGILRNSVVFIIGAMVIAPLLGPNVALSLATTLGDIGLSRRAMRAIGFGIVTALVSSMVIGMVFEVNPEIPELRTRTEVSLGDIVLALTAGSAAALSFTSELFSALIGVMVAVALLPPLVTFGMLAASSQWELALGSLFLFLINLICVNLAGVVTFLIQGIRPLTWWEATKAKKATRIALMIWIVLLMTLAIMIILSR
ncbi:MAG: TIGR00341 family protein [Candidatus Aminicenantes bacterium]|nr:MAG: TIGR00341 family protein [Candidatus Aminicenantes bacterium]